MKEVTRQIAAKNKRRAPEMTTKQGKLKADRKAKLQRIYLDDLASLENFSIVIKNTFFNWLYKFLWLIKNEILLIAFFFVKLQDSIVDQLEQRYKNNVIYTYIGDILVAVNPFTELGIYSDRVHSLLLPICLTDRLISVYLNRRSTCTGTELDQIIHLTYLLWPTLLITPCCINGGHSVSSLVAKAEQVRSNKKFLFSYFLSGFYYSIDFYAINRQNGDGQLST
jgi:hypothetical protein